MQISKAAIKAFNQYKDVTFNDDYNKQQNLGTKAESDCLHKVSADLYGICRDGRIIKQADVIRAGHTIKN